jgi:NIMA (never in mitosis gene a)-related kinase 1/4/5
VKRTIDQLEYALKKVKLHNLSEKEKENAINEVRILASIKHPSIIQYKEAFYEQQTSSLWYIAFTYQLSA